MLQAIIEQHHGRAGGGCGLGCSNPPRVSVVGGIWEQEPQFGGLVTAVPSRRSIAPADDGRSPAAFGQVAGQPGHQRGLSRATQGQIANCNDWNRRLGNRAKVMVEAGIAKGDGKAVRHCGQGQASPSACREQSGQAAIDQAAKAFRVGKHR